MFKQIWNIIKKNLKLLIRSKTSGLIVILGPLLVILLIATAFNTSNLYGIKVGTFSSLYSELSNSLVDELTKSQFTITKFDSEDSCIQGVKSGDIHICAIFPPDLKVGGTDTQILFYVDYSRVNLVYTILDTISDQIGLKSAQLTFYLTEGLLGVIDKANLEVTGKKGAINSLSMSNAEINNKLTELAKLIEDYNFTYDEEDYKIDVLKEKLGINTEHGEKLNPDLYSAVDSVSDKFKNKLKDINEKFSILSPSLTQLEEKLGHDSAHINLISNSMDSIVNAIGGIEIKNAETISQPITTKIKPVTSESTHLNYMFPTLLVLVIMFISILLSSTLVVREKISDAYFRNYISPTNDLIFLISNYLTNIIVLTLQVIIIMGIASFFFKDIVRILWTNVPLALFIITTVFILLGMVIGYLFRSEETANLAAISISSLLLFFSNTILPIESLPQAIIKIVNYNPFVMGEKILKQLIIFKKDLSAVESPLFYLLAYAGVLFLTILIIQIALKESYKIRRFLWKEKKPKPLDFEIKAPSPNKLINNLNQHNKRLFSRINSLKYVIKSLVRAIYSKILIIIKKL